MVKPLIESAARGSMERTLTSMKDRLVAGVGATTRAARAGLTPAGLAQ